MRYLNHILFLIIIGSLVSCSSVEMEKYPDGTIKSEVQIKKGKKNGLAKYYYSNGKPQLIMNYVDDRLDGLYEKFAFNGLKTETTMYSNGLKNGESKEFDEFGNLKISVFYLNDTIHGEFKEYYSNGQIRVSGHYNHGMYDGKWNYYDAGGMKVGYADFNNGTGKQFALYNGSNRIKTEVTYVANLKDGDEIWYDIEGNIEKKTTFSKGKIVTNEK